MTARRTVFVALTSRLALAVLAGCAVAMALLLAPWRWIGADMAAEIRRSGAVALPLASYLILLTCLLATWLVARRRGLADVDSVSILEDADWRRVSRAARLPQVVLVPPLAMLAAVLAWALRPALAAPAGPPQLGFLLGGLALALSFLALIAERTLAAADAAVLPEAVPLRALAFVASAVCFASGVLEIAANLGLPATAWIGAGLALLVAAVGVELSVAAMLRLFLPLPAPLAARAAVSSFVARGIAAGARAEGGIAAPLRQHLGIDFSRSWALAYVRAAALPMAGFFVLLAWGLSGVVLVKLDQRAVYERFGAPVAVLHPGLHFGLPWPLGVAREVEYGPVHAIGLNDAASDAVNDAGAEDPAPASADRLWTQAHATEVDVLIASDANGRQSFQSVSADLRILYRVGLDDAAALSAAYAVATPEALVRASAGRVVAAYFATRTLDDVLGANREAMADALRARLQAALDGAVSGLVAVAVVIEAIRPPAGAADAYHNVRAAEIAARASIAVEQGAAATIRAQSAQYAFSQTSNAAAMAAETVDAARAAQWRFTADQEAAKAGGPSFLLERYFNALTASLARAPKTIIDHRLAMPEAPVLDLRPLATGAASTGKEE